MYLTPSTTHGARPRAGQHALVEMGHQLCAGEHGLQGASVQELESPKEVLLSWVWSTPFLLQLKLKQDSEYQIKFIIV